LGDELAGEGALEDALAEAGGAGKAVVDGDFDRFDLQSFSATSARSADCFFERQGNCRENCAAMVDPDASSDSETLD
jgi:hypothetical protein